MKKQREKEVADWEVGGDKGNKVQNQIIKGRQLDIKANKEGRGAKQEQSYKPKQEGQSEGLEKLRVVKEKVKDRVTERLQEQSREREGETRSR